MRTIEFSELNLKEKYNEDEFFQLYINSLPKEKTKKSSTHAPTKKYEIFWLNILGGKIILLNKKHIRTNSTENQELYYDYKTAYKIYTYLLDIYDCIEAENYDMPELYLNEKLEKSYKISKLQQQDDILFKEALEVYNDSLEKTNTSLAIHNEHTSFFSRLINKIFNLEKQND